MNLAWCSIWDVEARPRAARNKSHDQDLQPRYVHSTYTTCVEEGKASRAALTFTVSILVRPRRDGLGPMSS